MSDYERALREIAATPMPIRGDSTPAGQQCRYLKSVAREALEAAGLEYPFAAPPREAVSPASETGR